MIRMNWGSFQTYLFSGSFHLKFLLFGSKQNGTFPLAFIKASITHDTDFPTWLPPDAPLLWASLKWTLKLPCSFWGISSAFKYLRRNSILSEPTSPVLGS